MHVFFHLVYELQKGLRDLALCTEKAENTEKIKDRLKKVNIPYLIQDIGEGKINIFFGNEACVNVIRSFNESNLTNLSDEQDFILGIMLGYDRLKQCKRYLTRIGFEAELKKAANQ